MRAIHILFTFMMVLILTGCGKETVFIVHDPESPSQEEIAGELASYLKLTYPELGFQLAGKAMEGKRNIELSTDPSLDPANQEAYLIKGNPGHLQIKGSSERGLIHGAYALLKDMGWQFYLSFEIPPYQAGSLDLASFGRSDAPAKDTRIIFNWHNFMSGCSGWNLEDWQSWTTQARKTGFNTIMVHAYGNNPMQPLQMNGIDKEVGYLTTTRKGRDWGSQHVNDVRRMIGGNLFTDGEFGSDAAKVSEDRRSPAAVELMQQVFIHADELSMNICYAIDVDTWMANPQAIMQSMPAEALLEVAEYQLANPDHPEGKAYYREKLGRLLSDYPQITHLAAWMRRPPEKPFHGWSTAWLKIQYEDMPPAWKEEFNALSTLHPEIKRDMPYPAYFATSKIIRVYREILDEIKPGVELLLGSWQLYYPPIADLFMPEYCGFIPLDYSYVLNRPDKIEALAGAGNNRKLYPVVWAHHDDHRYMGRPYVPYENFSDLLDATHSDGYGIIHWTTHPLDLLFENYEKQVWNSTLNQDMSVSVKAFCSALLKEEDDRLFQYYQQWFSEGPMFGRETMDHFIDTREEYTLEGYESALDAAERAQLRLALLESLPVEALTSYGKKEIQYQVGMEKFIYSFFSNHHHLHRAHMALEEGDLELAGSHAEQLDPEYALKLYAATIGEYGATRGEKGLLVSLNLRWLPDYTDLRQRIGREAVRMNFQPTSHDPVAQAPGRYTFFIDEEGQSWNGLGRKECGPSLSEGGTVSSGSVMENWITLDGEIRLPISTLRDHPLPPGKFRVDVIRAKNDPGNAFILRIEEEGKLLTEYHSGDQDGDKHFNFQSGGKAMELVMEALAGDIRLAGITITPQRDAE